MMETPHVVVESDYDHTFETMVLSWIEAKGDDPFNHERIVITAGPYRPYAVTTESRDVAGTKTLFIDFYSALRNGFGSLSKEEVEQIIERL